MAYQLMVAGQQWLSLAVGSSLTTSDVAADAQHRYIFSFAVVSTPGQQALLVLTGLHSPASLLPSIYITDPSISGLVSPDVSSPFSYTVVMHASSASSGSLQSILTADCSAFPASSACLYKVLVLATSPLPAYAIALTSFNDRRADQQQLSSNRSVVQSVAAGSYAFFSFNVTADVLELNVTLSSSSVDGSADLLLSTTTPHPNAASTEHSQWAAHVQAASQPQLICVQRADARWRDGVWYLAVFGQRATDFTLALSMERSVPVEPDAPPTEHSGASVGVYLGLLLLALCCAGCLALAYCYKAKRGLWSPARSGLSGFDNALPMTEALIAE